MRRKMRSPTCPVRGSSLRLRAHVQAEIWTSVELIFTILPWNSGMTSVLSLKDLEAPFASNRCLRRVDGTWDSSGTAAAATMTLLVVSKMIPFRRKRDGWAYENGDDYTMILSFFIGCFSARAPWIGAFSRWQKRVYSKASKISRFGCRSPQKTGCLWTQIFFLTKDDLGKKSCQQESGWWFQSFFIFHFIYGMILPIDELHHFSEG